MNELTHQELINEYDRCQKDWSKYSCDSFGFYIIALHQEIVKRGGWILKPIN